MSTIDEYVQELIWAQEEQIARKIYQETIIPYLWSWLIILKKL